MEVLNSVAHISTVIQSRKMDELYDGNPGIFQDLKTLRNQISRAYLPEIIRIIG